MRVEGEGEFPALRVGVARDVKTLALRRRGRVPWDCVSSGGAFEGSDPAAPPGGAAPVARVRATGLGGGGRPLAPESGGSVFSPWGPPPR